jgi:hypothetical protein
MQAAGESAGAKRKEERGKRKDRNTEDRGEAERGRG